MEQWGKPSTPGGHGNTARGNKASGRAARDRSERPKKEHLANGRTATEGSTKERILDIALHLFNEQGYDKTSLREIAERLGTTKAALYYHFERKEDILLELHLRLHALGRGVLDEIGRLEDTQQLMAAWPHLIDELIDKMIENGDLFLLHQRNRNAFERLEYNERHQQENEDFEQQMRRLFASPSIPLPQRVRMACTIAVVIGALMGAGDAFGDVPAEELAQLVREAAHDLWGAARAPAAA
ncbi:MAG TPA: TetR/AcrR family transcriptional regulator [Solirubrobacteraceae bacterium]|jgi:AcrR family transcriptional regulator